jgi:hypothetical protein
MPGERTVTGRDRGQSDAQAGTTRCRECHKPIIWPGRCYTCATGLPRRLNWRRGESAETPSGSG